MGDGVGNQEASTFRYYFGDGTETSGYNDFYIFGMVYIPSDKFPTEINENRDPGDKVYGFNVKEGAQSLYMTSAKMIEVSMGFVGGRDWSNDNIRTSSCRWGWSELHFYLAETKGTSQNHEKRAIVSHTHSGQFTVEMSEADVSKWLDRPFYFEIHLHKESTIGTADGSVTVTYYNIDGTEEEEIIRAENLTLLDDDSSCYHSSGFNYARGNAMKFNWLNLESNWRARDPEHGNHDAYLRCGNHLDSNGDIDRPLHCSSYYDDLIINDTRIAPTYFAMLNNQATEIRADVDQQNGINTTDAMLTLRNSLGLDMTSTNWQPSATTGDVDCNNTSNSTDAMLILRYSLGLDMGSTNWCIN
jgi:hypothetical protein